MSTIHFETRQVHAGSKADPVTGACATPLYQTASYTFPSIEDAALLFSLEKEGYIYTRLSNPTVDVFEKRIASLEGGTAAVATASGQAAEFLAVQNLAAQGDNIVCSPSLYGGTIALFGSRLPRFGIEARFARSTAATDYESQIDDRTKALYVETVGNSDFFIPDFDALAAICRRHGIPLVVDNTFGAGGYLFRPFEHGANVIIHSATKWIGGHGNSIAGVVVDGGNFDWGNGKFAQLSTPNESYHGLNFWETFGGRQGKPNTAFAQSARCLGLRDTGACLSPFNALLILQGMETLSLRVQRAVDNTQELARWFGTLPQVASVNYPGLPDNPNYDRACKYFPHGPGAVLSVVLKGSKEETAAFVERLQLVSHLANVGDNKTLIVHPASTTHGQLDAKALAACGLTPATLRIAVGIEHLDDLKDDFAQALNV